MAATPILGKRQPSPDSSASDSDRRIHIGTLQDTLIVESNHQKTDQYNKKPLKSPSKATRKRQKRLTNIEPCSHDDVHWKEVVNLLGQDVVNKAKEDGTEFDTPFSFLEELELKISCLSSNGQNYIP